MKDDRELLSRFEAEGSQEAFEEIVRRHLDLVYSVAMRQTAGDEYLAKDVCQQVFVSLARKAASLKERQVVSGWLYRAAKFEACRTVRNEALRRTREREAGMEYDLDEPEAQIDWEQARPLLDEAIAALSESERDAICLRFYESRRFKEIGESLDVSENTARMRVNRSLDKLRDLLRVKGIKSSAATLAVSLGGQATIAAPVGLAQAVSTSAVAATGSGLLINAFGIMNTIKLIGIATASAAAIRTVAYLAQEDDTPDPTKEPIPQTIEPQAIAAIAPPEADEPAATIETEQERQERQKAEVARLKKEEEASELEDKIRKAIQDNEIAMNKKKENPANGALSKEEQLILKRFMELRETDKEAAYDLLVSNVNESSSRAMYFMAGSTYGESGDVDMAIDFYKTGLEKIGGQNRNLDRRLNRNLGIMLVQQEKFEEAKQHLQQTIYLTKEPDNMAHGLFGLSELNTGNPAAAEYHYRRAVELNPESRDWSLGLAQSLVEQEKYQEANTVYEEILERFSEE